MSLNCLFFLNKSKFFLIRSVIFEIFVKVVKNLVSFELFDQNLQVGWQWAVIFCVDGDPRSPLRWKLFQYLLIYSKTRHVLLNIDKISLFLAISIQQFDQLTSNSTSQLSNRLLNMNWYRILNILVSSLLYLIIVYLKHKHIEKKSQLYN